VDPCFFCLSASAALLQLLALSFLQQIFSHPQLSSAALLAASADAAACALALACCFL
jgi:hypothetical protein